MTAAATCSRSNSYTRQSSTRPTVSGTARKSTIRLVSIETISAPATEITTPASTSGPTISCAGLSQVENSIRNASDNCKSGITSMTGAIDTAAKKNPCAAATHTPDTANQRALLRFIANTFFRTCGDTSASDTTAVAAT